jgi:hypothetical protein
MGMFAVAERVDLVLVGIYFIMQGVGVFLERTILKRLFGGKVDGWKGQIWTMAWILIWANLFAHAWFMRGLAASMFMPPRFRPSIMVYNFVYS